MPTGYFTDDYFPKVPGPLSATEVPKQMKVLKGYTFRGQKGDLLSAFQVLYPGNMMDHVEKVFARMKQENSNTAALTAGEWLVFLCLLIAATLQKQSGHALWDQAPYRPFSREHPGFGDYMRRRRFDEIKAACTWAFRDDEQSGTDKWFKFRPAVDAYNANRLRTVHMSEVIVPDEAMSPFRPRTTADGGLAHISFIDRNPSPWGPSSSASPTATTGSCSTSRFKKGPPLWRSSGTGTRWPLRARLESAWRLGPRAAYRPIVRGASFAVCVFIELIGAGHGPATSLSTSNQFSIRN